MSSICIKSELPDFSYVIRKNPSTGMIAKKLKKGSLFGWYSKEDTYNCLFIEGQDELSYPKNKDSVFSVVEAGRYNHPLFIADALQSMFSSTINTESELDIKCKNTIIFTAVHVRKPHIITSIVNYIHDYAIDIEEIPHTYQYESFNEYKIILTANDSLRNLLSLSYLLSYVMSSTNDSKISIAPDIAKKIVSICNLLNLPYYARYIVKTFIIKDSKTFELLKEQLELINNHTLSLTRHTNQQDRYLRVESFLLENIPDTIIDFGCGEGYYLKLLHKLKETRYIAIDKNTCMTNTVNKKAKRLNITDRVNTYNDIKDFTESSDFENLTENSAFLMVEVFEHNDLAYNYKVLSTILSNTKAKIIITTPNKDFNKYYPMLSDYRHPDHKFELTKGELYKQLNYITTPFDDVKYSITNLGDEVDGDSTSLLAVIYRVH